MKLLTVVGARPQFVKASVFSRRLKELKTEIIEEVLVHTGQHYDVNMSKNFFELLKIPEPQYNLNVGSGDPGWQTSEMIRGIEEIILKENT